MRVACLSGRKWSEFILYEDSHCHPFFVPKYTTGQKIAYAVKAFMLGDEFRPNEEICSNCGQQPGTQGCMLVGKKFVIDGKLFFVDHTNKVDHRLLDQDVDDETRSETPPTLPHACGSENEDLDSSGYDDDSDNTRVYLSNAGIHVRKKVRSEPNDYHGASSDWSSANRRDFEVDSDSPDEEVFVQKVQVEVEPTHNPPEIEPQSDESQKVEA